MNTTLVVPFDTLGRGDVALVGGKNASLGELTRHLAHAGVPVPPGFAVTADAYRAFLDANDLPARIAAELRRLDDGSPLAEVGERIRTLIRQGRMPGELVAEIAAFYAGLAADAGEDEPAVAVRSSATAEDLPEASFAGQQESFLNVRGLDAVVAACQRCFASLFTDRAINYRRDLGFGDLDVALSVGVQVMAGADRAGAGTAFSLDTETGFPRVVLVNAAWGLGESVVSGAVDPDEYVVFKPLLDQPGIRPVISRAKGRKEQKVVYRATGGTTATATSVEERDAWVLTTDEILRIARWVVAIEHHYGTAVDVEWAKDGRTGELFVVQARPETVQTRRHTTTMRTFRLREEAEPVVSGLAVGDAIGAGVVCKLSSAADIDAFPDGGVLVTGVTDPDWEPIMKKAAAIVTDHGGRTSHAAIVSRELGVPAVVGTGSATTVLADGDGVTVSCAEGDRGHVYRGRLAYSAEDLDLTAIPATRTRVMLNVADPAAAFRWWRLPAAGVGLLRMEFLVANHIKVHPMALAHPEWLDSATRQRVERITRGSATPADYFVDRLADGIGRIAAAHWPEPVVVRMSDFKTNEYATLVGGAGFEPSEENPMLGWRGASRYYAPGYRDGFALECRAIRRVRDAMGLRNVIVMIPFCRTPDEGRQVLATMADEGLVRGENGLKVYVMAEIPSNIILAARFAELFDGFSIGSNDLTQLTLGVDRDSDLLAPLFDERDPAVEWSIRRLLELAHAAGAPVGLCGQRPSDDPDFARTLVRAGIDSISVTPDSLLAVIRHVADAERAAGTEAA
ncbi:phosphoenolpyruvate synthase [Jiangella rhizosphaerae]|uniref:Phosphoenolpyruvate synthase n=1 Tax=Jiangella rhizosphaerae TaxID=2293569 RepID=A0A418KL35_9ACTN|nr:phosphoenolpyruvate synthase [Jiangella rhizosphaerae]RIQ18242.1 phosphoenolpyruvate synthase [Jiangella rhizosphaerae]